MEPQAWQHPCAVCCIKTCPPCTLCMCMQRSGRAAPADPAAHRGRRTSCSLAWMASTTASGGCPERMASRQKLPQSLARPHQSRRTMSSPLASFTCARMKSESERPQPCHHPLLPSSASEDTRRCPVPHMLGTTQTITQEMQRQDPLVAASLVVAALTAPTSAALASPRYSTLEGASPGGPEKLLPHAEAGTERHTIWDRARQGARAPRRCARPHRAPA